MDASRTKVAVELGVNPEQVEAVARLLADEATVPFIARYRKEATGGLDEVQIASIRDRLKQIAELDKRREAVEKSLAGRGLLTPELTSAIAGAETIAALEDVYLPFRPKRRTRATVAREKGLEPLAQTLMTQSPETVLAAAAQEFVNAEKGVETVDDALAGARDIIAEMVSEDADVRRELRAVFAESGAIATAVVKGKEEAGAKFRDYFDWHGLVARAPSHRLLAVFRGENEEVLSLTIRPPEEQAIGIAVGRVVRGTSPAAEQVRLAVEDGYRRLIAPSLENDLRAEIKERADKEAIRVFAQNVRELLMAAPLGQKPVLGIDPGFRTGCKVVALDAQGKLLADAVVYPTQSKAKQEAAGEVVRSLCEKHAIAAIAIGNGTAGRETEAFVRALGLAPAIAIVVVNESGASVYSASKAARAEFPDKDVTVRGSVSIGRRLMDPLAELVKIDPKAIGVGQYQHDVDQGKLKQGLDDTVTSCVNAVGVEVNTASVQLLTYVSGLKPALATSLIKYREANGPFASREALRKVPRLGPKAFEQAAGFLRIRGGDNPLDASAVHPESYGVVDRMAETLGCSVKDLIEKEEMRARIDMGRYVSDTVGLPTLNDIVAELAKPGRDPRKAFEVFSFAEGVSMLDDLKPGMKLPGIVTNVTNFGAFVDIGVHQDGLVHISELADTFVKDPADIIKVQQRVEVTVLSVDRERNRISLSMKSEPGKTRPKRSPRPPAKPKERESRPPARPKERESRPPAARGAPPATRHPKRDEKRSDKRHERRNDKRDEKREEKHGEQRFEWPTKRPPAQAEPESNWLLDAMRRAKKSDDEV
jgi:uncharacterized protein